MTCHATLAPLPREIREAEYVVVRHDGAVVVLLGDRHVTCPGCQRAAAIVIVRGRAYACVGCDA